MIDYRVKVLRGEPSGSGDGKIGNKSESSSEGLRRVKGGSRENKGRSAGREAG